MDIGQNISALQEPLQSSTWFSVKKHSGSAYYRSENAENEPEKLKIPVAEPTDKRDNIFMIQGDDYLDRLEEKLTR